MFPICPGKLLIVRQIAQQSAQENGQEKNALRIGFRPRLSGFFFFRAAGIQWRPPCFVRGGDPPHSDLHQDALAQRGWLPVSLPAARPWDCGQFFRREDIFGQRFPVPVFSGSLEGGLQIPFRNRSPRGFGQGWIRECGFQQMRAQGVDHRVGLVDAHQPRPMDPQQVGPQQQLDGNQPHQQRGEGNPTGDPLPAPVEPAHMAHQEMNAEGGQQPQGRQQGQQMPGEQFGQQRGRLGGQKIPEQLHQLDHLSPPGLRPRLVPPPAGPRERGRASNSHNPAPPGERISPIGDPLRALRRRPA